MNPISRLFYLLTAFVPRRLPATEYEFCHMQDVLVDAYGVTNEAKVWATVCGHMTAVPSTKIRISWGKLATAAKRLEINMLINSHRQRAGEELQKQLIAAFQLEQSRQEEASGAKENEASKPEGNAGAEPPPEQAGELQPGIAKANP
jgi:hypothetical protein